MKYHAQRVGEEGVRFKLEEGTPSEMYKDIALRLGEFFEGHKSKIIVPCEPDFESMRPGRVNLYPAHIKKETGQYVGRINMNYFSAPAKRRPVAGMDFPASESFSVNSSPGYAALTIFFNTLTQELPIKHHKWANGAKRDLFMYPFEFPLEERL